MINSSHCWKCGCHLEFGAECDNCVEGFHAKFTDEELEQIDRDFNRDYMEIDWSKVETFKDLIAILSKHGEPIFIAKASPEFKELQKFLKPIDE